MLGAHSKRFSIIFKATAHLAFKTSGVDPLIWLWGVCPATSSVRVNSMKSLFLLLILFLIGCGREPERSLLDDRPEMRFAGAAELLRIADEMGGKWNPAPTKYKAQSDFEKGIMLREGISLEEAWEGYFFEIQDIRNKERFMELYRRGVSGEFTREEWVRENAWVEYCSAKESVEFADRVLIPIFLEHNRSVDVFRKRKAFSEKPFEEVMQVPETSWPWNYWGDYYDTYLSPRSPR